MRKQMEESAAAAGARRATGAAAGRGRGEIRLWLKSRQPSAACSSHRATVFQAIPSTRAIADRLTPSTRRATTASNRALRCWSR